MRIGSREVLGARGPQPERTEERCDEPVSNTSAAHRHSLADFGRRRGSNIVDTKP
jgi:hypothetical protein